MAKPPTRRREKPKEYRQAGKTTIRDREGYLWTVVGTVDKKEADRLKTFYSRAKKEFRIVPEGKAYLVLVRKG